MFVYRITVSNNIPADLMKGEKVNSNEKDAGFVPSERNSNFFPLKTLFLYFLLLICLLGRWRGMWLVCESPHGILSVCARFLFLQNKLPFCKSCYFSHNSVWKRFSKVNVTESKDQEMCCYFLWQVLWLHKFAVCFGKLVVMQDLQTVLTRLKTLSCKLLLIDPPLSPTLQPLICMDGLVGLGVKCSLEHSKKMYCYFLLKCSAPENII